MGIVQPALFAEMPLKRFRRRRLRTDSRWSTAVHEAGHAVAALWFGLPIECATIRPGMDGSSGKVMLAAASWGPDSGKTKAGLVCEIAVFKAAGFVAQEMWGFEAPRLYFWETFDCKSMLDQLGLADEAPESRDKFVAAVLAAARSFLANECIKAAVLLLACALERQITIDQPEAERIVKQVLWRSGADATIAVPAPAGQDATTS